MEKKKILCFNFNGILTEVIEELKKQGHEVISKTQILGKNDWKKFDIIVTWNATEAGGLRGYIPIMQKAGKRVVLVQHGRRGTSRIWPPFSEKVISDAVCLWGQGDYERHIATGNSKEKLFITGSPLVKWIKDNVIKQKHEGKNVLFFPEHWGIEVIENVMVSSQLRKLKGVNVMTKVLEGEQATYYQNPIYSNRHKENHLEILGKCLSIADVVVGISESTAELFAEILDIPVVIADIWQPKPGADGDERYLTYRREYSNACDKVKNIFQLNTRIEHAIKHPEELRNERFIIGQLDGGTNIENPVQEIIKVILNG